MTAVTHLPGDDSALMASAQPQYDDAAPSASKTSSKPLLSSSPLPQPPATGTRPASLSPSSLSPSSRHLSRVSPSPPPLPSKPPARSRPSLSATSKANEESTKKVKTDARGAEVISPRPFRPKGVGRLTMAEDDDADDACEIVTTVVVKQEKREEKRMEIRQAREGEDAASEPGAPGAGEGREGEEAGDGEEVRRSPVPRLGLGLRLGGFEEAKDESELSTIAVYTEEAKEEGRPRLTLHATSSSSAQLTPRALSLPTGSSSRPTTPHKGLPIHLHAEDGVDSSIIITTTTTTTTTTSTTQHMRLLPLAPGAHSSSSSSSTPYVPSVASNLSTTQTTSSRAAKLNYYLHNCTEITSDLFISGQIVASDSALLHRHGITHIVNACGAVCDNCFPGEFSYFRLYLQDKGSEDVLCILYDVFDFIRSARAGGGKALIHCQQGVSRSTVLGIGYLMMQPDDGDGQWTYADYQTAYSRVRSKRGISSPNLGFVCQLLAWSRRLLGRCTLSSSLYRFAVHSASDTRLVNKWMDTLDGSAFDARFILLMQSPHAFFLWVGEDVSQERLDTSRPVVQKVVRNLQRYEFGVQRVVLIRRSKEGEGRETVSDVSDEYGLTAEEWVEVEARRADIRAHSPADAEEDDDNADEQADDGAGAEGDGGGEEGDTDRMRERQNRNHTFDAEAPAAFFYAVMGGRPELHCANAQFTEDFVVETQAEAVERAVNARRTSSRSSLSSLSSSSSSSSSSSRISVVSSSVQKMQISPTLGAVPHRGSGQSLSSSPRSRGQSAANKDMPPLPANPPPVRARRKLSREGESAAR